jgi:hypothetical protein
MKDKYISSQFAYIASLDALLIKSYRLTFPLPGIIYDPTLVLSPHVFLLGMLFKAQAFKDPVINSPEKLYSLNVLDRLGEQRLPLKEELNEEFVFCRAVREANCTRIARDQQATTN